MQLGTGWENKPSGNPSGTVATKTKTKTKKMSKMSKIRKMMDVTPPPFLDGRRMSEQHYSKLHLCPHCHGNGWIWVYDWKGESEHGDCPVCNGSGRLNATIKIEWKAAEKLDNGQISNSDGTGSI